ncbi:hypothetical protein BDV23DRAFT_157035 [Aspergillus alliaceus]|uniref:Uncharacterized protein n=1 Tax=Petromyces alliaceus TaxID=209559 RepID=A0A5N7C7A0_PETAA|nr:hypothetical protein BDV23DRAFT_157035 [Aspergillus alliaceus]
MTSFHLWQEFFAVPSVRRPLASLCCPCSVVLHHTTPPQICRPGRQCTLADFRTFRRTGDIVRLLSFVFEEHGELDAVMESEERSCGYRTCCPFISNVRTDREPKAATMSPDHNIRESRRPQRSAQHSIHLSEDQERDTLGGGAKRGQKTDGVAYPQLDLALHLERSKVTKYKL